MATDLIAAVSSGRAGRSIRRTNRYGRKRKAESEKRGKKERGKTSVVQLVHLTRDERTPSPLTTSLCHTRRQRVHHRARAERFFYYIVLFRCNTTESMHVLFASLEF
jgi:hypothetical protein